ncbi:hypothetical protein Tco_0766469, partial [Tanacetum coccineum]
NSISLTREEEEKSNKDDVATCGGIKKIDGPNTKVPVKEAETKNGAEIGLKTSLKKAEKEEAVEALSSQPIEYYLKHRINEKLIEGLVDNNRDPVYEAILKKKITKKEDIGGNFEIPCNIGGLKLMNALVDQGKLSRDSLKIVMQRFALFAVKAYLVKTETPESPHTVASPTPLLDSTPPKRHAEDSVDSETSGARPTSSDFTTPLSPDHPLTHASPTLVPILRRTTRMAVRVPPAMSPGLSASIEKVVAMSNSTFHKSRDKEEEEEDDEEDDDEEEDEEIDESLDSDSESEEAEDEAPVVETAVGEPLGLGYEALRRQEIALREGQMPSVFEVGQGSGSVPEPERPKRVSVLMQPTLSIWIDPKDGIAYIDVPTYPPPVPPVQTPPSPEWSSGSFPVSLAPSIVPSPISSPMIPLTVPSPVASPATAEAKGFLTELGSQVEMNSITPPKMCRSGNMFEGVTS